jgi:hypothetical protein
LVVVEQHTPHAFGERHIVNDSDVVDGIVAVGCPFLDAVKVGLSSEVDCEYVAGHWYTLLCIDLFLAVF